MSETSSVAGRKREPVVGIIMGSDSDLPTLQQAADACVEFGVPHEVRIVSAHRTPLDMAEYGRTARERGIRIIIAGAGGAAHLPGIGRGAHHAAGDRRARSDRAPARSRLAAVDRSDAGRRSGRDGRDRRRQRTRPARAADPRRRGRGLAARLDAARSAMAETSRQKNRNIVRDKPRARQ